MKIFLLAFLLAAASCWAQPTYTQITDTIYTPVSGVPFNGRLYISNPVLVGTSASSVGGWQYSKPIVNGAISVALVPNDTALPAGTTYVFRFVPAAGSSWTQYCTVPTSGSPVKLSTVCAALAPVVISSSQNPAATAPTVISANVGTGADTTEDTLMTYTLPAGSLAAGKYLKIKASFSGMDPNNNQSALYFGATQLCSDVTGGNGQNWSDYEVTIVALSATTQKAVCSVGIAPQGGSAFQVTPSLPSETLSGAVIIRGTGIGLNGTANEMIQRLMIIEPGNF